MHGASSPWWPDGLTDEERAPFKQDPYFSIPIKEMGTRYGEQARSVWNAIAAHVVRRKIFKTEKGYLGWGGVRRRWGVRFGC